MLDKIELDFFRSRLRAASRGTAEYQQAALTADVADVAELTERERAFFDRLWQPRVPEKVVGKLRIPGVGPLAGKRVLICSCGSGVEPVLAARVGADVYAFDISPVAVQNACDFAAANGVKVTFDVMDFHCLTYPADFFDIAYGSAILHHVDCSRAGSELYRCLRPGGVACFFENSDGNPVLRWFRRLAFGKPGEPQRSRFLFFRRYGTPDEYPLTREEIAELGRIFQGSVQLLYERFVFFELAAIHGWRWPPLWTLTRALDSVFGRLFPSLLPYSFLQHVLLTKPSQ